MARAELYMVMTCGGWTVLGLLAGLLLAFVCRRYFLGKADDASAGKKERPEQHLHFHSAEFRPRDRAPSLHDLDEVYSYATAEPSEDRHRYIYISLYPDSLVHPAYGLPPEGQRTSDGPQPQQQQQQQQIQQQGSQLPRHKENEHQQQLKQHCESSVHDLHRDTSPHRPFSQTEAQTRVSKDDARNTITDNENGNNCNKLGTHPSASSAHGNNHSPERVNSITDEHTYLELISDPLDASAAAAAATTAGSAACSGLVTATAATTAAGVGDEADTNNAPLKARVRVGNSDRLNARFIIVDDDDDGVDQQDHRSTVVIVNVAKDNRKMSR